MLYAGHGGLLDIAVDPEFEQSHLVYLSYSPGRGDAPTIRVLRARFDADNGTLTDQAIISRAVQARGPSRWPPRLEW